MDSRRNILYISTSIIFAFILFVYATANNYQTSTSTRQTSSETYTNTINNVPIDIEYDSDTYFISGFASEVSVQLTGSNRVTLASEMQESTRSFRVVATLNEQEVGTQDVALKMVNLPTGLTATINPDTITVKIGKKASKTFEVEPMFEASQVAAGVTIEQATVSDSKVTVTSDEETLSQIDHVEAVLPSGQTISGNYSGTVQLQAVDAEGNVLPSVISPYETTLKILVTTTSSTSSTTSSSK